MLLSLDLWVKGGGLHYLNLSAQRVLSGSAEFPAPQALLLEGTPPGFVRLWTKCKDAVQGSAAPA